MLFESPQWLWGLFAVPFLLLLGLWRFRPTPRVWPSISLWELIPARTVPVREVRKPRLSFALLLQALAVGAAVVALAGPMRLLDRPLLRTVVIIFDTSASLQANHRISSSIGKLQRTAEEPWNEYTWFVIFGSEGVPVSLHPMGPDYPGLPVAVSVTQLASNTLSQLAGWGENPSVSSIQAAADWARSKPRSVLFWVSDREPPVIPQGVKFRQLQVGGPSDNVGIVGVRVTGTAAELLLQNASRKPQRVRLRLDSPAGVAAEVDLPARGTDGPSRAAATIALPADPAVREVMISIDGAADSFPADDRIRLVRRGGGRRRVVLFGRSNLLLQRAIAARPDVDLVVAANPEASPEPLPEGPADLWIFNGRAPEKIPVGPRVWIGAGIDPPDAPFAPGDSVEAGRADRWDDAALPFASDAEAGSGPDRVRRIAWRRGTPPDGLRVRWGGGDRPWILDWAAPDGTPEVLLAFDLPGDPSLPGGAWTGSAAFPLFWSRLLDRVGPAGTGPGVFSCTRAVEDATFPGLNLLSPEESDTEGTTRDPGALFPPDEGPAGKARQELTAATVLLFALLAAAGWWIDARERR